MFLFVEDNGADLAKAASSLARLGSDGSRAVDTAQRAMDYLKRVETGEISAPEAVIVDLLLRAGAGQDVIGYVKASPVLRHIPVLVWTVVEDETQHGVCMALGAREVLVKSRRAQELREAILRLKGYPQGFGDD